MHGRGEKKIISVNASEVDSESSGGDDSSDGKGGDTSSLM